MKFKFVSRLIAMTGLLTACGGGSDTVSYGVQVTAIELIQKGSDKTLAVQGLPSASATLTQPRRGRGATATQ